MFRNKSVDVHQFAMVPRNDIPRSSFRMQKGVKTAFDAGYLVPIFCEEILPGDTFNCRLTAFCRLATPIFPVLDNLYLETFFFFVPNRLVWTNWVKLMGEQNNPADSIAFTVPTITSGAGGYGIGTLYDYFGLPTVGQVGAGNTVTHSALPLRGYNRIFNEWFRDENLVNSLTTGNSATVGDFGDGPDGPGQYVLQRRGKRHDYFTTCLPWLQKGGVAVSLAPTGNVPVWGTGGAAQVTIPSTGSVRSLNVTNGLTTVTLNAAADATAATRWPLKTDGIGSYLRAEFGDSGSTFSLSINSLRLASQIQVLLERDARGGTRYTEKVREHFGVMSPDARLQRTEYLGGGKTPVVINPIAQTSATGGTGTPQGNLAAMGTALVRGHGFTQSFTEHGYVIGLAQVNADLTYQQGMRRHWSRQTQYDFYVPAFALLGEQAVLNREIYCDGSANDALTFGYNERWAEYRYNPSEITGLMRSTAAGTIDPWHLAQRFTALPTLNATFIADTPPLSRVLAVGAAANGQQLLCDLFYDIVAARPMPLYSVPGSMVGRF